jgi:hypothetical protein
VPNRCPLCAGPLEGNPEVCPHCGRRIPAYGTGKCQFCGTRVKPGAEKCSNCGAPVESPPPPDDSFVPEEKVTRVEVVQTTTTTSTASSKAGCGIAAAIITLAIGLPILFGVLVPGLVRCAEERKQSELQSSTLAERDVEIIQAQATDSIYRGMLFEDGMTVEDVWPRVLTDLPDSCSWLSYYSPCAVFGFTTTGGNPLCRLMATAPFDLVMGVLRVEEDGSLTYLKYNDDGISGSDPEIDAVLPEGDYIAIVAAISSGYSGEVRFVWDVMIQDIPVLQPDTTLTVELTDFCPLGYFYVDIHTDSTYTIESSNDDFDSYLELHTAGGSVLSDDDGGDNWNDARLSFQASALHEGRALLIVRHYSEYDPETGTVTLTFSEGALDGGGSK